MHRTKTELFEIQRPIASNVSMSNLLIYNQDRSIETQFEADEDAIKLVFEPHQFKVFVLGYIAYEDETLEKGQMVILDVISEKSWPNW